MVLSFWLLRLTGYAVDPLQARYYALQAGILLGLVTATWHIVSLLQAERSPVWIAWWFLGAAHADQVRSEILEFLAGCGVHLIPTPKLMV